MKLASVEGLRQSNSAETGSDSRAVSASEAMLPALSAEGGKSSRTFNWLAGSLPEKLSNGSGDIRLEIPANLEAKIGRASCRERV